MEHVMPQHTVPQQTMPEQTVNPTNSPLSQSTDNHRPDDDYLRMLRFYLQSNRWVEDQISAELEVEIASELQNLGKRPVDWSW
jgi:hypothetical protein